MEQHWIPLSDIDKPYLQKNLDVLQSIQPALAPVLFSHRQRQDILLRQEESSGFFACKYIAGGKEYQIQGRNPIPAETDRFCSPILDSFKNRLWLAVVFAAGQGILLPTLVSYLENQHRGEAKGLLLMEHDPGLLCAGFSTYDFSAILRSGRILFATGNDLFCAMRDLCREHRFETLAEEQTGFFMGSKIEDPARQKLYQKVLQQYVFYYRESRSAYLQLLKKAESYWSVPSCPIRKVWTQVNDERAGGRLLTGLADGFRDAGLESSALRFDDRLFTRFYRCAYHFFAYQPDLILSLNHSSDYTASFAKTIPIPRVVWYVDHPSNTVEIPFNPYDQAAAVTEQFFPEIQRRGGKILGLLPAACSEQMEEPTARTGWKHDVSYVGMVTDYSPVLSELSLSCRESVQAIVEEQLRNPLSLMDVILESHNRLLLWRKELGAVLPWFFSKALYMSEDRLLNYFLYSLANSVRRVRYMESLVEFESVGIYGPGDWLRLLSPAMQKHYYGPIDTVNDLTKLYQSSKVNLSINSLQGFSFLNPRIFEVPAAGGFLLAEYIPGLENFFEKDHEMAWFTGGGEMVEQIRLALQNDEERISIIKRMQEKIRKEHTFHNRAEAVLQMLRQTCVSG